MEYELMFDFTLYEPRPNPTDAIRIVHKYGLCLLPNYFYMNKEILENLKTEFELALEQKGNNNYKFGRAARLPGYARCLSNYQTIGKVFGEPWMNEVCRAYYGRQPFSVNHEIFLTHEFKHPEKEHDLERNGFLHYDRTHAFKFFFYMTDVNEMCGPLHVIPCSQDRARELRLQSWKETNIYGNVRNRFGPEPGLEFPDEPYRPEMAEPIYGKSGTLILLDTDCLHYGGTVREGFERRVIRGHCRP